MNCNRNALKHDVVELKIRQKIQGITLILTFSSEEGIHLSVPYST